MDVTLEEPLVRLEIVRDQGRIVIKVYSELGGFREYTGRTFHEALRQMSADLIEEIDKSRLVGDVGDEVGFTDY